MKNINTPKFWDKQFKQQNKEMKEGSEEGTRFNPWRFSLISGLIEYGAKDIIDIGCGMGELTRFLHAKDPYFKITGVDFSPYAIEMASNFSKEISYSLGETNDTKVESKSFDVAVALDVIEHVSDPEAAIKEMSRVLCSGGQALIGTPYKAGEIISPKDHVKEYSPQEMSEMMGKEFTNISVHLPPVFVNPATKEAQQMFYYVIEGIKE